MKEIKDHSSVKWYIAYSNDLVYIHFGDVQVGNQLTTGLDNLEVFDTESEMLSRKIELTGS